MEDIKQKILESLDDNYLSREESSDIQKTLAQARLDVNQRFALIRYAIREAAGKMDAQNHSYVMKWLRKVSQTLSEQPVSSTNGAFFSHQDDIRDRVIDTIRKAKKSLDVCVFTISENNMANAILEVHKRNIPVRVITDDEKIMDRGSDIFKLKARGIKVKIDSNDSLMHHKFTVVDGRIVVNGSFNWTRTASEVNNENVVITDNPSIVNAFRDEFGRLWEQMKDL